MFALVLVLSALTAIELVTRRIAWSSRGINLQAWAVSLSATIDLGEYLFHRAQHASPLLWRMHSLHHSDHDMNATTTNRHFWGDSLLKALTIWPLAALIVAPTPTASAIYVALSLWNYFSHSAIDVNFGRWSWLINSPAYHRRHHSIRPEHYGSNFAALFPVFDVIAGSYHRPVGFPPTGLDERPEHIGHILLWPLRGARLPNGPVAAADRPAH
ncbi:MAG: hypothetical protein B7Z07_02035 [Sphingomonadales bacterium 32-67-7]|nr:MAG: hypothetical protein B7Z07_02035 [Sphingomonadales bacterium 32-67-7]